MQWLSGYHLAGTVYGLWYVYRSLSPTGAIPELVMLITRSQKSSFQHAAVPVQLIDPAVGFPIQQP